MVKKEAVEVFFANCEGQYFKKILGCDVALTERMYDSQVLMSWLVLTDEDAALTPFTI